MSISIIGSVPDIGINLKRAFMKDMKSLGILKELIERAGSNIISLLSCGYSGFGGMFSKCYICFLQ